MCRTQLCAHTQIRASRCRFRKQDPRKDFRICAAAAELHAQVGRSTPLWGARSGSTTPATAPATASSPYRGGARRTVPQPGGKAQPAAARIDRWRSDGSWAAGASGRPSPSASSTSAQLSTSTATTRGRPATVNTMGWPSATRAANSSLHSPATGSTTFPSATVFPVMARPFWQNCVWSKAGFGPELVAALEVPRCPVA